MSGVSSERESRRSRKFKVYIKLNVCQATVKTLLSHSFVLEYEKQLICSSTATLRCATQQIVPRTVAAPVFCSYFSTEAKAVSSAKVKEERKKEAADLKAKTEKKEAEPEVVKVIVLFGHV